MSKTKAPLKTELEILNDQLTALQRQLIQLNEDTKANIFLTTIIEENIKKHG